MTLSSVPWAQEKVDDDMLAFAIVLVLEDNDGAAPRRTVYVGVSNLLEQDFESYDLRRLWCDGRPRWQHRVDALRRILISEGTLAGDAPHGIWKLAQH